MKVACVSDVHAQWDRLEYPQADVLVIAGDMFTNVHPRASSRDLEQQMRNLLVLDEICKELKSQGIYQEIIGIAGNHDYLFERENQAARNQCRNFVYLQDEEFVYEGVKFYGSPYTKHFYGWAFNFPDHSLNPYRARAAARDCWEQIPSDTQVLITHGPPLNILDECPDGQRVGDEWIGDYIKHLTITKLHVFGHIHHSYGQLEQDRVVYVNAAACNEAYEPVNPIQVVEI